MLRRTACLGLPVLAAALLIILASCHRGDRLAPEGATIELAATPTTIVLVGGSGSAEIVATVSSMAGVPLPDQDVRFTSSAGSLFTLNSEPAANVPIRTDDLGNARVTLTTTTTTTVTARSGKAS